MADTYWAEREGARWDVYGKQRGWMAQADTEDDARLIVAGLESLQAPPAAAVPAGYVPVSALIEARDHVEDWAAYSSPYFQEKHDLAGVLAEIDAQIAQAQQPAAAVPDGMALVPVEPTTAMKCRAVEAWEGPAVYKSMFARGLADLEDKAAECWAAMLAAARKGE